MELLKRLGGFIEQIQSTTKCTDPDTAILVLQNRTSALIT